MVPGTQRIVYLVAIDLKTAWPLCSSSRSEHRQCVAMVFKERFFTGVPEFIEDGNVVERRASVDRRQVTNVRQRHRNASWRSIHRGKKKSDWI